MKKAVFVLFALFVTTGFLSCKKQNTPAHGGSGDGAQAETMNAKQRAAEQVVISYFKALDNRDYHAAYNIRYRDFDQEKYNSMVNGYARTVRHEINSIRLENESGGEFTFVVDLHAQEAMPEGMRRTRYTFRCRVGKINGVYKMLHAETVSKGPGVTMEQGAGSPQGRRGCIYCIFSAQYA